LNAQVESLSTSVTGEMICKFTKRCLDQKGQNASRRTKDSEGPLRGRNHRGTPSGVMAICLPPTQLTTTDLDMTPPRPTDRDRERPSAQLGVLVRLLRVVRPAVQGVEPPVGSGRRKDKAPKLIKFENPLCTPPRSNRSRNTVGRLCFDPAPNSEPPKLLTEPYRRDWRGQAQK